MGREQRGAPLLTELLTHYSLLVVIGRPESRAKLNLAHVPAPIGPILGLECAPPLLDRCPGRSTWSCSSFVSHFACWRPRRRPFNMRIGGRCQLLEGRWRVC